MREIKSKIGALSLANSVWHTDFVDLHKKIRFSAQSRAAYRGRKSKSLLMIRVVLRTRVKVNTDFECY